MTATLVVSPGQIPIWLGSGQLRTHRLVEQLLGGRDSRKTTIRAIAGKLDANPGAVSRELGRLSALGLHAQLTRRGRLGFVELFRIVGRSWAPRLDPRRRARALLRMGVGSPGQLTLALAVPDDEEPTPLDELWPATPAEPGSLRAERDPLIDPADVTERIGSAYGQTRCACGRLRLTYAGDVAGPCPHEPAR